MAKRAVHLAAVNRQTACTGLNVRMLPDKFETTTEPSLVTCKRCQTVMRGESNGRPARPQSSEKKVTFNIAPVFDYEPESVLSALEQAIEDVCDESTRNAISDRYRELIGEDTDEEKE